jgi:hypothetical protein
MEVSNRRSAEKKVTIPSATEQKRSTQDKDKRTPKRNFCPLCKQASQLPFIECADSFMFLITCFEKSSLSFCRLLHNMVSTAINVYFKRAKSKSFNILAMKK